MILPQAPTVSSSTPNASLTPTATRRQYCAGEKGGRSAVLLTRVNTNGRRLDFSISEMATEKRRSIEASGLTLLLAAAEGEEEDAEDGASAGPDGDESLTRRCRRGPRAGAMTVAGAELGEVEFGSATCWPKWVTMTDSSVGAGSLVEVDIDAVVVGSIRGTPLACQHKGVFHLKDDAAKRKRICLFQRSQKPDCCIVATGRQTKSKTRFSFFFCKAGNIPKKVFLFRLFHVCRREGRRKKVEKKEDVWRRVERCKKSDFLVVFHL